MNLAMQQEQFDSDKELVEGTLSSKDEDQDAHYWMKTCENAVKNM